MTPYLTFYGDDFTGSSAAMEVPSFAGVPPMLFMEPPHTDILSQYPELQTIGVAGIARSKDPAWMNANLATVFEALKRFGAPVSHCKTCSTFEPSPKGRTNITNSAKKTGPQFLCARNAVASLYGRTDGDFGPGLFRIRWGNVRKDA